VSDELREQIRRLEELVAGAAGALAFPALAEAHRRAGHPEEAERVARDGLALAPHVSAGRVALALALLDQKRNDETRVELERLLGGDSEHVIAHDAAAFGAPEGVGLQAAPVAGELATLDPYPGSIPITDEAPASEPIEESPSLAIEPAQSGPFGPPPPPVPTHEFGPLPPPAPAEPLVFDADEVRDDELDDAFDQAEADREQMFGTDDVAEAALSAVTEDEGTDGDLDPMARAHVADGEDDLAAVDGLAADGLDPILSAEVGRDEDPAVLPGAPGSPFATETFAGLLERQGHVADAERLREQIAAEPVPEPETPEPAAETAGDDGAPEKQATLERWLDNLRRDT